MSHPLPICEALELLGLTGAQVARQLGLHPNVWGMWRKGQVPHAKTKSVLLLLAKRLVMEARQMLAKDLLSGPIQENVEQKLEKVVVLIADQELKWSNVSIAGLIAADKMLEAREGA